MGGLDKSGWPISRQDLPAASLEPLERVGWCTGLTGAIFPLAERPVGDPSRRRRARDAPRLGEPCRARSLLSEQRMTMRRMCWSIVPLALVAAFVISAVDPQ